MSTTFHHDHERAVVHFGGNLDWASAMEFVDIVDGLVSHYFYRRIKVVVTSPGGATAALDHVVRALERWRNAGVAIHTRVVAEAASAAAVLVSLGDDRAAEPGARLMYHYSRVIDAREVTAHASTHIHSALTRVDRQMVERIVTRALRTAGADAPPHHADPTDRFVAERLADAAAAKGRMRKARSVRALARAVGRAVDAAVERGDRARLTRLYRALFATGLSISAELARTLRLIDRIGVPDACALRPAERPGLTVPEWRALYPPHGTVPRKLLTRHVAILGETGSGKTVSAILPVVGALARARRGSTACALVLDPKHEIVPMLERLAPQRLQHLTAGRLTLNVMSGPRWALDADLAARRWVSAAGKVLLRAASFVPASPLRALEGQMGAHSRDHFFDSQGAPLALDVLAFLLMLLHRDDADSEIWLRHDDDARAWIEELRARARGDDTARGTNSLALCAWALDGPLVAMPDNAIGTDTPSLRWLFERIALPAQSAWGRTEGEERDLLGRIIGYWSANAIAEKQHVGIVATAREACSAFAAPAIARTLYFGWEPGAGADTIDFARLVSRDGDGRPLVFQPARDALDRLIAVALKALFFEAVLADPDRARGADDVPLVGYVCDEFHKYVTSDAVHGEQSFLDTCRSYGTVCVLATQSLSSIEHALSLGGGTRATHEASLKILWNNTAAKLVFRSTDASTADCVAELCPNHPGWTAVTRVRPLSTLAPGECYAALPDGRFERRQLRPFADDPARERDDRERPAGLRGRTGRPQPALGRCSGGAESRREEVPTRGA